MIGLIPVLVILLAPAAPRVELPLQPDSVRFAVIGDMGTGERPQYELAEQLAAAHRQFPFDFVLTVGDNIYGGESAEDFKRKFEIPYAPLLSAGVKFYATLGNHDQPAERNYAPFNMRGKRYYSFSKGNAEFFALDSNYMDPEQLDWLKRELTGSKAAWKICYFHHPLYNEGRYHGADKDLRAQLEPIFRSTGVTVVFSGHEHVYQRLRPQNGIYYFGVGSSGKLMKHDFRGSPEVLKGMDSTQAFLLAEIAGDKLYFQVISRTGETVDSGVVARPGKSSAGLRITFDPPPATGTAPSAAPARADRNARASSGATASPRPWPGAPAELRSSAAVPSDGRAVPQPAFPWRRNR